MNTHAPVVSPKTAGTSTHKPPGLTANGPGAVGAAAGGNLFANLLSDAAETATPAADEPVGPGVSKLRKGVTAGLLSGVDGIDPLSASVLNAQPAPVNMAQPPAVETPVQGDGPHRAVILATQGDMDVPPADPGQGSVLQGRTPGNQNSETGFAVAGLAEGTSEVFPGADGSQIAREASRAVADAQQDAGGARAVTFGPRASAPAVPFVLSGPAESTLARWSAVSEASAPGPRVVSGGARPDARARPAGGVDQRLEGRLSGLGGVEPNVNEAGLTASSWVMAVQGGEPTSGLSSKLAESRQDVLSSRSADAGQAGAVTATDVVPPEDASAAASTTSLDELASQVAYLSSQGVQSAQLTVETEGGERVEVRVDLVGNEAQVAFRSDVPETRAALERASDQLQGLLAKEGLVLSGVSIGAQTQQQQAGGHPSSQAWAERRGVTQPERSGARGFEPVSAPVRSSHQGALDIFV